MAKDSEYKQFSICEKVKDITVDKNMIFQVDTSDQEDSHSEWFNETVNTSFIKSITFAQDESHSQDPAEIMEDETNSSNGRIIVFAEDSDFELISDNSSNSDEMKTRFTNVENMENSIPDASFIIFSDDLSYNKHSGDMNDEKKSSDAMDSEYISSEMETYFNKENTLYFQENLSDDEEDDSSECDFNEADFLTEENYSYKFPKCNKGTLKTVGCNELFKDDDEYENLFSSSLSSESFPECTDFCQEGSELSQSYENEAFDNRFEFIFTHKYMSDAERKVNEKWNHVMKEIEKIPKKKMKPKKAKKVCFASSPNFISHFKSPRSSPSYYTFVLDKLRFQRRINETYSILTPILTLEHREKIMKRNSISF